MRSSEIGQIFLKFHSDRGFSLLPGSSMLDPSIPMTFVMSAGLVQVEMALRKKKIGWSGKRYAMLQKCFRHFDVQTVGSTDIHLSLFEMPAAFSFGSYTKASSVQHMWELLTSALGCPKEKLWITYFAGDQVSGHFFDRDIEVYRAWRQAGLPPERIIGSGADTNFWKQGDGLTGKERYHKCASYTEAFLDRGAHLSCGPACRPGCHCGRFVEVANSLFVDSEIDEESNSVRPLEAPFVEVVAGTERLAMALGGKESIFDIEDFVPLKATIRRFNRIDGTPGVVDVSENVLADHWRALFFLVADGAPPPGKDGRRRIIKILVRRIATHQLILGIQSDFSPVMADTIISMNGRGPQLAKTRDTVLNYVKVESRRFMRTLARGKRDFEELLADNDGDTLTGEQVVFLEKKRGVPCALVEKWLLECGLSFDRLAYEQAIGKWQLSENAHLLVK